MVSPLLMQYQMQVRVAAALADQLSSLSADLLPRYRYHQMAETAV
jgi:hypothetical protein